MTGKQQVFSDTYINEPTLKKYEVAKKAGYKGNVQTLSQVAVENLKKPEIVAYLAKHSNKMEEDLIELGEISKGYARDGGKEGASYAAVAERVYNSVLDRVHGKAKQSVDLHTTSVSLSIDLTGTGTPRE